MQKEISKPGTDFLEKNCSIDVDLDKIYSQKDKETFDYQYQQEKPELREVKLIYKVVTSKIS